MSGEKNYGFVEDGMANNCNSFPTAVNSTEQLPTKNNSNVTTVELRNLKKFMETENYDPHNYAHTDHPTTSIETFIHLLKGSMGTGILAMPLAFYHSGYILGVIGTIFIGFLCTYSMQMLINCEYEMCKRKKVPSLTYPATAEYALLEGPMVFRKIAPYAKHIINVLLFIYQMGSCTVYTVFIAENIQIVLKAYVADIDERWIMLIFLLPLIFLNYIRNLKLLAPLSTVANFMTLLSFGIILYYMIQQNITVVEREPIGDYKNFPLFLGTVYFALEAIGVIMPLKSEMKTPKLFGGACGVLNIGMITIVVLYVGMGLFGYLAFGSKVGGSISYTIGSELPAQICKVMLAIAIYITYALQMYPAIDIAWTQYLLPTLEKDTHRNLYEYITRTLLVFICFCLAVAVPYIDLFISLFGALSLSAIGIAFPAIIDLNMYWSSLKGIRGFLIISKNCIIIIFAFCGQIAGTSTSLAKIVEKYNPSNSTL